MMTGRIDLGKPWVVMLVSALLAGGCGTAPDRVPVSAAVTGQPAEQKDVTAVLYDQYREWRGTPYRYGGTRRDGIDCSAFVARTLRERFDTSVPRTTVEQSRSGRPVPRGAWQPGDLVFFQTGYRKHHVGIYVDNGRFLHASSSEGVTLSNLAEPYWSSRYWTARRWRD